MVGKLKEFKAIVGDISTSLFKKKQKHDFPQELLGFYKAFLPSEARWQSGLHICRVPVGGHLAFRLVMQCVWLACNRLSDTRMHYWACTVLFYFDYSYSVCVHTCETLLNLSIFCRFLQSRCVCMLGNVEDMG